MDSLLNEATEEEKPALREAIQARNGATAILMHCANNNLPIPPPEQTEATVASSLDRKSNAWGFFVLLMYKPHRSLRHGQQPIFHGSAINVSALDQCIQDHLICAHCHAAGTKLHRIKLQKCSQCKELSYCSKTCQKADWKAGHKENCKKAVAGAPAKATKEEN